MLRRSEGLVRLSPGGSGQDWVLARQYCAFNLLDASSIPLPRRKAFATMAVQRWSPFAESRFHIDWAGPLAMVWAWSPTAILDLGGGETSAPPRKVWPESLYRGLPSADGANLLAMDEGVEGRVWRDHAIIASQWWPEPPPLSDWNAFRQGAGLPATASLPNLEVPPLAALPWTRQRVEAFNDLASRHRRGLQAVAIALACAVLVAPLAASLRLVVKTALLERVIAEQTASVGATLGARESAERDRAAVVELLQLRPPARQLRLLSTVMTATPGTGWKLLDWRMPDPGSVEAVLQMASPDPTAIVKGWEGSGVFSNVAVDLGGRNNEITVRAKIVGGDDPLAAVEAAP